MQQEKFPTVKISVTITFTYGIFEIQQKKAIFHKSFLVGQHVVTLIGILFTLGLPLVSHNSICQVFILINVQNITINNLTC